MPDHGNTPEDQITAADGALAREFPNLDLALARKTARADERRALARRELVEHLRQYRHAMTMSTDEIMSLTRGEDD